MGHKVNPIGFRTLINSNYQWKSSWFADRDYAMRLVKDLRIRDFITEHYAVSGISDVIIERSADRINLIIKASRPGMLIGKKGGDMEKIKNQVKQITNSSEINIKVIEVTKPDVDATLIAQGIAKQIEKRVFYKRAVKKAIENVRRYNVNGIKIRVSGRLGGAEIARSEEYKEGSVSLHTLRQDIDYALAEAYTTYGVIGIKVWVSRKF